MNIEEPAANGIVTVAEGVAQIEGQHEEVEDVPLAVEEVNMHSQSLSVFIFLSYRRRHGQ